jgi:hypothetical protein
VHFIAKMYELWVSRTRGFEKKIFTESAGQLFFREKKTEAKFNLGMKRGKYFGRKRRNG